MRVRGFPSAPRIKDPDRTERLRLVAHCFFAICKGVQKNYEFFTKSLCYCKKTLPLSLSELADALLLTMQFVLESPVPRVWLGP